MAFPLLALVGGGLLATRAGMELSDRKKAAQLLAAQDAGFNNALANLGPTGAELISQPQLVALDGLYDADRDAAMDMLSSLIQQNNENEQAKLQRDIEWAKIGQQRDTYNLNVDKHELARDKFIAETDVDLQRQLAQAGQTGVDFVRDPVTDTVFTVPAAGTDDWIERVDGATMSTNAANTFNEYAKNVAEFGVLSDPSHPAYGIQDSLRTQTTFAIKEATNAGALDAGLLEVTSQLTGSATDATDYFLGNDAQVLGRIGATARMFDQQMRMDQNNTRLLSGVSDEQKNFFRTVATESQQLAPFLEQRIAEIQAEGGNVLVDQEVPVRGQAGGGRNRTPGERAAEERGTRTIRVRPGDRAREQANILGSQIDEITSGIVGAMLGRGFR